MVYVVEVWCDHEAWREAFDGKYTDVVPCADMDSNMYCSPRNDDFPSSLSLHDYPKIHPTSSWKALASPIHVHGIMQSLATIPIPIFLHIYSLPTAHYITVSLSPIIIHARYFPSLICLTLSHHHLFHHLPHPFLFITHSFLIQP